jgi:membrane-associated protease RseP (regulator of RpoE activity)
MPDFSSDPLADNAAVYSRFSNPAASPVYAPIDAPKLRYGVPLLLLVITFCTTVLVGSRLQFNFDHHLDAFATGNEWLPLFPVQWLWQNPRLLLRGVPFSLALMSILLAHEMGHYLYCRYYRVRATLPFFIPAPTLIGTLGAFIRIGGRIRSRAALFDIGIAGPIAGFVVAVPTMLVGLALSHPVARFSDPDLQFGFPLIFQLGHWLLHRAFSHPASAQGVPALAHYYLHPVAIAGWAGMLATALNLLPGGQLDGGHLVFAVSPRMHRFFSWAMVASLVAMAWFFWVGWMVWAILLALSGLRQPSVPQRPGVGRGRMRLSLVAVAMLILTFTPAPVANSSFPQVAHMIKHGSR